MPKGTWRCGLSSGNVKPHGRGEPFEPVTANCCRRRRLEQARERHGEASKRLMERLVDGEEVRCYLNGERSYDRVVGVCFLGDQDIGSAGLARDCPRYSSRRYEHFNSVRPAQPRGIVVSVFDGALSPTYGAIRTCSAAQLKVE